MAKVKYNYSGPPSGFTLRSKDAKGKVVYTDVSLFPGQEVELDSGQSHVKSLVARGHLTEVKEVKADKPPKPDTPKTTRNTPNQSQSATATEVANG